MVADDLFGRLAMLVDLTEDSFDHINRLYQLPVGIQQFSVSISELELWVISSEEASRLLDGGGDLRVGHGESLVDGFEFVAGVLVDGCFVVHDLKSHFALDKPVSANHSRYSH